MNVPEITLYVDVVSPFAYEAFHILQVSSLFLSYLILDCVDSNSFSHTPRRMMQLSERCARRMCLFSLEAS